MEATAGAAHSASPDQHIAPVAPSHNVKRLFPPPLMSCDGFWAFRPSSSDGWKSALGIKTQSLTFLLLSICGLPVIRTSLRNNNRRLSRERFSCTFFIFFYFFCIVWKVKRKYITPHQHRQRVLGLICTLGRLEKRSDPRRLLSARQKVARGCT